MGQVSSGEALCREYFFARHESNDANVYVLSSSVDRFQALLCTFWLFMSAVP